MNGYITVSGYNFYEVMSAIQKLVRRGMEELALFFTFELAESGRLNVALSRLRVMAHEDIGLGCVPSALFAIQALDDTQRWHPKNGAWRLSLTNAVLALCRADKSRDADNAQAYIHHQRRMGWKPNIPDFCFDKHTSRGKRMGRGAAHFVEHATKLIPKDVSNLEYRQKAKEAWLWAENTGHDLYDIQKIEKGQKKLGDEDAK